MSDFIVPQDVLRGEHVGHAVPPQRHAVPPPVVPVDLLALSAGERELFDAGWWWGYLAGVGAGHAQAADEAERSWRVMADRVRRMATTSVAYSVLCDERGEPERAERAREHERRLGLIR